jgi:hypothetical protein
MIGPFFFEATVTGTSYLTMLQDIIFCISDLFLSTGRWATALLNPCEKFSGCSFPQKMGRAKRKRGSIHPDLLT